MTTIPPNWLGSIIQSHGAQRRATEARAAEDASAAERKGAVGGAENRGNVIDNDDTDSSVYADAEGAGGQGRSSDEEPHDETPDEERDQDSDQSGLDIQA